MENQLENSLICNKELFLYAFNRSFLDFSKFFVPIKTLKEEMGLEKSHNLLEVAIQDCK